MRYAVSIEELNKNIPADHANKMIYDDLDNHSVILYAARDDNHPIATLRITWGTSEILQQYDHFFLKQFSIFPPEVFSFSSKLVIDPQWRHKQILGLFARRSYKLFLEKNIEFNFCQSKPEIIDIYKRLGYRHYNQPFIDPNLGLQHRLVLLVNDVTYLKQVRSAFLSDINIKPNHNTSTTAWFHSVMQSEF